VGAALLSWESVTGQYSSVSKIAFGVYKDRTEDPLLCASDLQSTEYDLTSQAAY
jgi:hypothetical protein